MGKDKKIICTRDEDPSENLDVCSTALGGGMGMGIGKGCLDYTLDLHRGEGWCAEVGRDSARCTESSSQRANPCVWQRPLPGTGGALLISSTMCSICSVGITMSVLHCVKHGRT